MSEQLTIPAAGVGAPETDGLRIRPGAKALVRSSERVLLVKERHVDGRPYWTLPGGGVHPTESVRSALRRELAEELRCRPAATEPVTSAWHVHSSLENTASVYTVFACRLLEAPRPKSDEGILDLRWVHPDDLPGATLPYVRFALERVDSV